ncbi:MAG: hypothetical protein AB1643_02645 [Patescibacteria group bacterium]
MSLIEKIEEVHKKPEAYRKKVLIVSMLISIVIIIFIWVTTLDFTLGKKKLSEGSGASEDSPFNVIKRELKMTKENINSVFEITKNFLNQAQNLYER